AAALGNLETVQLLLGARGIDAVCSDAEGWCPLMNASTGGSAEIVEELLGVLDSSHINAANHDGDTVLLLAASNGHADVMEILLQVDSLNVN
ncbi:ankyrin, partial [Coprinopsis marcescibilis]